MRAGVICGVARTPGRDSQMAQPDTRVETAQPPKRFAGWPPKLGQRFGTVRANGPKKGNTSVTPLWPRCSMLRSFRKCCASSIKDGK